jgi:hypothetical protein
MFHVSQQVQLRRPKGPGEGGTKGRESHGAAGKANEMGAYLLAKHQKASELSGLDASIPLDARSGSTSRSNGITY